MIWSVLKVLFLALAVLILTKLVRMCHKQREWERQGVVFSGPLACVKDMLGIQHFMKKKPHNFFIGEYIDSVWPGPIKPAKVGLMIFGNPAVIFMRPEALNELYVTKNKYFCKH